MHAKFEGPIAIRMLQSPESSQPRFTGRLDIYGVKEAQSIGMTRGFSLVTSRLSSSFFALLLVLLAGSAFVPSAHAQSAAGWNKRGQDAELRQDYDSAYEDYLKAHNKAPKDMRYQARLDRMRFQAAAQHVDRGRVLRQGGDLAGALNQFTRALQIDPSNEAATQEIKITQSVDKDHGSAAVPPPGTADSTNVLQDVGNVSPPVVLKPLSDDLITLRMSAEDTKVIYSAIGKEAGLNVLFDPDYQSRRIPVDLNSVNVEDALRIVGTIAGTFYKVITPDTIFVAASTRPKHTDLDDVAVQTFYLTNASQQADANEIVTALRNVLDPTDKVFLVQSQNAIVLRAPPEHLVLAEKLLNDLDRTRAEVVVDVAILEVNRDKIRNLGITLPQSFGITRRSHNSSNTVASTTATGTATASGFTLNTLANINATNFAVSIGGGTLNALLSDADYPRSAESQHPRHRRPSSKSVPESPSPAFYSAGAATGITAGIGVQTQFTYLDVGVNIDMTPTIHLDRGVSLKLDVAVSTQSSLRRHLQRH